MARKTDDKSLERSVRNEKAAGANPAEYISVILSAEGRTQKESYRKWEFLI